MTQSKSGSFDITSAELKPYEAKRFRVPIRYRKVRFTTTCDHTIPQKHYIYAILAGRFDANGGYLYEWGKDVNGKDGYWNYKAAPKDWRATLPNGSGFSLHRGKSLRYTVAASVFGVGISASTIYDRGHTEHIRVGNKIGPHNIWGDSGAPTGNHARVFYSY